MTFDNELFGKNVRFLSAKNDIRIGEIEAEAGVSVGYISRIANAKNDSTYKILDLIFYLSEKFGISIFTLLTVDLEDLTENERFLSQFFEKLIKDTQTNKIEWQVYLPLKEAVRLYFPKRDLKNKNTGSENMKEPKTIIGDTFSTNIGSELKIIPVRSEENDEIGFQLILGEDVEEEVCTLYERSPLFLTLQKVYRTAFLSMKELKVSKDAKNLIEKYMGGTQNGK